MGRLAAALVVLAAAGLARPAAAGWEVSATCGGGSVALAAVWTASLGPGRSAPLPAVQLANGTCTGGAGGGQAWVAAGGGAVSGVGVTLSDDADCVLGYCSSGTVSVTLSDGLGRLASKFGAHLVNAKSATGAPTGAVRPGVASAAVTVASENTVRTAHLVVTLAVTRKATFSWPTPPPPSPSSPSPPPPPRPPPRPPPAPGPPPSPPTDWRKVGEDAALTGVAVLLSVAVLSLSFAALVSLGVLRAPACMLPGCVQGENPLVMVLCWPFPLFWERRLAAQAAHYEALLDEEP